MSLAPSFPPPSFPERAAAIRRATARLCLLLGWSPLHEVTLPNGRRADILALRPDGAFICIEIKSGERDFLTDSKWTDYRDYADAFYFAVDADFPHDILPTEAGLIVAAENIADLLRDAITHAISAPRRRSLTHRFATLAATRLAIAGDPQGGVALRTALRSE